VLKVQLMWKSLQHRRSNLGTERDLIPIPLYVLGGHVLAPQT